MENQPASRPYLLWRGENEAALYYIDQKHIYTIGRRCTCDVAFPNSCLLPIHVTIYRNIRRNRIGYTISACSSGQVAVNDEALPSGHKRDLAFHDVITLLEGTRSIRLIFSEKEAGIVDDLRPYLFWSSNSCVHVRYLEEKKCFSIGSDRACDVSLPAPHLAANHATIVRNICRGSIQFSIKPIFSRRAHVFVNGIQVSKKGTKTLTSGDILTVSKDPQAVKFRFNSGDGARERTTASSSPKSSSARNVSQFSQTQDTPSPDAKTATKTTSQKQQVKLERNDTISLTQLEANLTCCVCLNIFFKPINIDPCNHKCCYSCVLSWLQQNRFVGRCPQCRCTIMSVKLDPALNSIVETMLTMKPALRRSNEEVAMIEELEARNMREYQNLLQYSLTVDAFLPQPQSPWMP
uniref:E3 ubiquitin-protein ligase CHFR n=1 Tax=Haemonchus contortus TaxID=6289 RepID=A0A7I4XVZ2_HAECO|nr:Forkhead-associated and Zinc finger domain containing protein [Haemonchus contortus]